MVRALILTYLLLNFCVICRFGLPEQNFPICAGQTQPGPDGCQHVDFRHIVVNPMVLYVLWQMFYILVVSLCKYEEGGGRHTERQTERERDRERQRDRERHTQIEEREITDFVLSIAS